MHIYAKILGETNFRTQGQKQKTERKKEKEERQREKLNDGNNNDQATKKTEKLFILLSGVLSSLSQNM